MLYLIWLRSLLRRRWLALAAVTAGIAVSVALVATIAGFFAVTRARMTEQAIADVPIDWQVQLAPGTNVEEAVKELTTSPGYAKLGRVGYFDTPGLRSTDGVTTQETGPGKVLGLEAGYRNMFPGEIRQLLGEGNALLAQQTAANLQAQPGSVVMIRRAGLPDAQVTVDAVVDLPLADSLFQAVGAPPGSGPQAPPDNVLLLPLDEWHSLFDPVAATAPDAQHVQLHVTLPHDLPSEPSAAFTNVQRLARNYETRLAGAATIGDNLSARLDAARSDALLAEVLFFFLGFPGVVLAAVLTIVLISSSRSRRRREQALLRLRGASVGKIVGLAALEPAVTGIAGGVLGVPLASVVMQVAFGTWGFEHTAAYAWYAVAALAGTALPLLIIVYPAWREADSSTVARARASVGRQGLLAWERFGLDFLLLGLSALAFWLTARRGYEVVVAPEGVPRVSVSYSAFLPPLLLWTGAVLLAVRLTSPLLARRGRIVSIFARPIAGALSSLVGASLSRQRLLLAGGIALIAASIAFATSTAIFNSTYQAQARVDAELTNGADVTVTGPAASSLAERLRAIRELRGVVAAEPMQHRFAYVGTDLQDLYGVQPTTFGSAARLSDAFFANGNAAEAISTLERNRDGVLVSAETVQDFQLRPGDLLRLRLQNASDNQYHVVEFHYLGIAREFPTAPSDSFLVANADYIAQQTAAGSVETVLVRTVSSPDRVAEDVRQLLGPASGATVRDIGEAERAVHSSLTAISLRGLTRVELSFAIALATAGAGLVLLLGFEERRRTLAIATALGARPRQIGAFVWSEAALMLAGGLITGAILGWLVATMLVKLLTQVFDPPPEHLSVPWIYIAGVPAATTASVVLSALIVTRLAQRSVLETIRRL